ncbi:MAG: hypothetical protein WD114_05420 [Phycisphaerales bacterium]
MSDTTHRDSVRHKSFRSSKELVDYCKPIEQGWFRCQAIAIGAAKLEPEQCEIACRAAVNAAQSEKDAYRQIMPLAWPIEALASIGLRNQAKRLAEDAIKQAMSITPSNSKAEALDVMYRHFEQLDLKYRKRIFLMLVEMAEKERGGRIGRNCAQIAIDLDRLGEREFIDEAISHCQNTKLVGRIHRITDKG